MGYMMSIFCCLVFFIHAYASFSCAFKGTSPSHQPRVRAHVDPLPICTAAQRLLIHDSLLSISTLSRWARDVAHRRPIDNLDGQRYYSLSRYFGNAEDDTRGVVLRRFVNLQIEVQRTVDWPAEQGRGEGNVVVTCDNNQHLCVNQDWSVVQRRHGIITLVSFLSLRLSLCPCHDQSLLTWCALVAVSFVLHPCTCRAAKLRTNFPDHTSTTSPPANRPSNWRRSATPR